MDITLIIGPMFSGKSSELLRFMKNVGLSTRGLLLFLFWEPMQIFKQEIKKIHSCGQY